MWHTQYSKYKVAKCFANTEILTQQLASYTHWLPIILATIAIQYSYRLVIVWNGSLIGLEISKPKIEIFPPNQCHGFFNKVMALYNDSVLSSSQVIPDHRTLT